MSVEGLHERLIWLDDATVAFSPVGTEGAVVSLMAPPEPVLPLDVVAATFVVHAESLDAAS
ncbi:hypothetical protein D3C83_40470 [compost metagenome]